MREAVGEGTVWWAAFCAGAFLGRCCVLCWVQLVIRWTLPRFRYDQIQKLCWKMLLPVALGNVFLTGALILIDPSLELLAVVGLVELTAMVLLTAAVSRKGRAAGRRSRRVGARSGHGESLGERAAGDEPPALHERSRCPTS